MDFAREPKCILQDSVIYKLVLYHFHLSVLLKPLFQYLCFCENRFRPRILRDVSKIDLTTTVLGFNISMPIMIAPTAMQKMAHPEGIMSSIIELVGLCYIIRMILPLHPVLYWRCYI